MQHNLNLEQMDAHNKTLSGLPRIYFCHKYFLKCESNFVTMKIFKDRVNILPFRALFLFQILTHLSRMEFSTVINWTNPFLF